MIARPFTLLIKPTGPDCNIACEYCFYACKSELFEAGAHRMNDEVQEHLVKSYLGLRFEQSSFAWQGGEPTLMGLDFYKWLVELQTRYAEPGQVVNEHFALLKGELIFKGLILGMRITVHTLEIALARDVPDNHRSFVAGKLQQMGRQR